MNEDRKTFWNWMDSESDFVAGVGGQGHTIFVYVGILICVIVLLMT